MVYKVFRIENISDMDLEPQVKNCTLKIIQMNGKNYLSSFVLCCFSNMNLKDLTGTC